MKKLLVVMLLLAGIEPSALAQEQERTTCPQGWTAGPDADWKIFWDDALAEVRKTNKPIFALSTGSDWCGWCIKLKKEVLTTEEFKAFAEKNLVLLYLDSPRKPLPEAQTLHNRAVCRELSLAGGVPCAAVFAADARRLGVLSGGGYTASNYVERLEKMLTEKGELPKSGQPSKIFIEGYGGLNVDDADKKSQEDLKKLAEQVRAKKLAEAEKELRAAEEAAAVEDAHAVSSSAALSRIFARVLPGYTFKRSKMKGCRVDRVSPDGFWTYRGEDSKTNEVSWSDFYKRYPANLCEAINWFASNDRTNVLGGCRNRMSFLRLAACVIEESCPDATGAKEYSAKLRLQANELTQNLRESTRAESAKPTLEILAKKLADGSAAVQAGEAKKIATKKSHPRRTVSLDRASMDIVIRILQLKNPRFVCNGVMNYMPVSFRSAPGVPMTDSQVVSMACEALRMNGVSFTEDGDNVHIGRGVPTTSTPMWATSAQLKEDFLRAFKSANENVSVDASWDFQSASVSDVAGFLADAMKVALIFCPGLPQERISCACDGMTAYDAASKLYDELIAKKVALFEFEPGIWKAAPKKDAYETFSSEGKTFVRIVAGAEKYVGDVAIPASIGGNPVVSIGHGAFADCSSLTAIRIPSGVTNIEFSAFRGCKKLKSVTIPPSVTSIGGGAFENCISLESLTIPSSVKNLGYLMLEGCSGLRTLTISSLKGEPRSRHGALRSVTIPDGVTSIEREAFRDFGGIETVTIPNGVENIGALAFYYCSGLKSVTIPTSVTNIGHEAFAACSRLESVTIPSSVTSLGENAFSRCPKLTTVCVVRDGKEEQLTINEFKEQWKPRMADRASTESRRQSIARGKEKNARIWKDPQTEITWCYSVCKDNTASLKPSLCFSKGMPTLSGDVVIPEILDGHVVTDIVWWDIGDCVDLTSLRIPKTVRQLRMNSASVFTLTNVTIEAGCEEYRSDGRFVLEKRVVSEMRKANAKPERRFAPLPRPSPVTSRYSRLRHVCAGGIKRLVIPEGVETIEWECISGASWLEEVRIPSTVREVDASAFTGCKGLIRHYDPDGKGYMVIDGWMIPYGVIKSRDLVIPAGVRHIADEDGRTVSWRNVTSVKLPEGLVSIGQWAFNGSRVESIEFPASLERCRGFREVDAKIRSMVVSCPRLRSVVFNSGKTDFPMPSTVTNVTYNAGVTEISACCNGKAVKSIQLPSGLISIAKGSLDYLPKLTDIVIPSSVTNIGYDVFSECRALKSIGVEKDGKIEYVPIEAFRRHWNLRFPDGCFHLTDAKTGIRWIVSEYVAPYRAHSEVKGRMCMLVGIEDGQDPSVFSIPKTLSGMSVEKVDWGQFLSPKLSSALSPIEFELWYGRTIMGTPPARTNALSAVELRIPRTLEYVDNRAIERIFPNLQSIVVEDGNESCQSSDGVLCNAKNMAVMYCPRAREGRVTIAEGAERVSYGAFRCCTNLTEVVLPSSVIWIDASAFAGCSRLEKVSLPQGLRNIDSGAFSGCLRLEKLHLPERLRSISAGAFDGCVKLFEKSKRYDGFYVLDGWAINPQEVGEAELGGHDGTLVLPDGLRGVACGTFSGCTNLLSVTFPKSLTYIGDSAFAHTNIRTLELPEGVRYVGSGSFYGCTNLMLVSIPSTIEKWGSGWFYNGPGSSAFAGCTRLKSVHLAEGLRVLPHHGFSGCSSLESVAIPSSVTNAIGRFGSTAPLFDWFSSCPSLREVCVSPENPQYKSIDGIVYAKDGRSLLCCPDGKRSVAIPDDVEIIGDYAFDKCSAIEMIELPMSVTNIGKHAFYGCSGLKSVTIPEGVKQIGDCAFGNCRRLTEICMPSTVREIGLLALEGDSVPERILTAPGDAERILGLVLTNGHSKLARMRSFQARYGRQSKDVGDQQESRFVVEGDALVRTTSGLARWRDPETGIAWLYSVQGDNAVDVRTEFLEGYKGHLEVPAQLGGKQVSGLLGLYGGGDVTALSLPMSVTNVNSKALASCIKLKSVKMNVDGELKTIGIEDLRRQWNQSVPRKPAFRPARGNLQQGGLLRARRLQRQQQEAAAKVQADAEKAQREAEQAEQRAQLLAIQEELKRVREAKAAAEEKQKGK